MLREKGKMNTEDSSLCCPLHTCPLKCLCVLSLQSLTLLSVLSPRKASSKSFHLLVKQCLQFWGVVQSHQSNPGDVIMVAFMINKTNFLFLSYNTVYNRKNVTDLKLSLLRMKKWKRAKLLEFWSLYNANSRQRSYPKTELHSLIPLLPDWLCLVKISISCKTLNLTNTQILKFSVIFLMLQLFFE